MKEEGRRRDVSFGKIMARIFVLPINNLLNKVEKKSVLAPGGPTEKGI